jgi:hypothetical protein
MVDPRQEASLRLSLKPSNQDRLLFAVPTEADPLLATELFSQHEDTPT